jgi:hypothetical protein
MAKRYSLLEYRRLLDLIDKKSIQEEPDLIRAIRQALENRDWLISNNVIYDPREGPKAEGGYITTFVSFEGDDQCNWKEKEVEAIRDPASWQTIIGLKRTLEYMKGGDKGKRLFATEYVAVEPCGGDDVQIRVRTQPTNHTKITKLYFVCKLCLT